MSSTAARVIRATRAGRDARLVAFCCSPQDDLDDRAVAIVTQMADLMDGWRGMLAAVQGRPLALDWFGVVLEVLDEITHP